MMNLQVNKKTPCKTEKYVLFLLTSYDKILRVSFKGKDVLGRNNPPAAKRLAWIQVQRPFS